MTKGKAECRRENVGNRKKLRQWLDFYSVFREESSLKIFSFFEYYLAC